MRMPFSQSIEEVVPCVTYGSQAQITRGIGSTRRFPRSTNKDWFAGDSTLILGASHIKSRARTRHIAVWHIALDPSLVNRTKSGYLVVACERVQGGLHTRRYGALAKVTINGSCRDLIGLKSMPPGHVDYFHRVETPPFTNVWPLSGCGTIYAWPIHRSHLRSSGRQIVGIEIDPQASWDIDYVVLLLTVSRSVGHIPEWLKQVAYAAIGAGLGAVATLLLSK